MKKYCYPIICITLLTACFNNAPKQTYTNATDAGTAFIRATLDGDFTTAQKLLLNEPKNMELFDTYKAMYQNMSVEKKQGYKNAAYNINTLTDVNDSVSIINYSNTYMKQPIDIKIVKTNGIWLIDFKHTLSDSTTINND